MKTDSLISACLCALSLVFILTGDASAAQSTVTLPNGQQNYTVFNWTLSGATGDTYTTSQGNPSNTKVSISEAFNIVLSGTDFTDDSWMNPKSWAAFTSLQNNPTIPSFTLNGSTTTSNAYGSFGYNLTGTGMNVTWAPIPEPTSALAGMLLVGGLLRRRR